MAAMISSNSLPSADWKASAEPSNWVVTPAAGRRRVFGCLDRIHRLAQRIARRDIEGDGGGGELAQMVDLQRHRALLDLGDGRQRHLAAARGRHIDVVQRGDACSAAWDRPPGSRDTGWTG